MPSVLALDIGTSSIRATVYDARLRQVRSGAQVRYAWRVGGDGAIDAGAALLERAVARAIDEALDRHRRPIDAVATAAFWHSLVGVDRDGRAVTPVLPWSDTRSATDAETLRSALDEAAVHARTGCRLHPTYWPARLRWFARREPGLFRRVHRWMSFPAYLERLWLGRCAESRSQASGTGMFAHATGAWDAELCAACGVAPDRFAPIVDLDDAGGELARRCAARWPSLRRAVWVPAAGDGALNNIGAGCTDTGRAAVMIGTSGALRLAWDASAAPAVPFTLWRYCIDRRRVVVGGALSNGGNLVAWMRDTLGLSIDRRLEARVARVPPDSHGLTMLPFLAGERSPDYLPDARATIAGLRLATTREEILRAGLEAVAYRLKAVFDELCAVARVEQLVATGTALTASPVWMQIVADVLGRPLVMPREPELTSRGAAIIALERLGAAPPNTAPAVAKVFTPDGRSHDVYRAAADRQRDLLARLSR